MPPKFGSFRKFLGSLDNSLTIGKGFLTGKLKFGTPTEYKVWHQSFSPIKEFKVLFPERWDAATHGADPNLIWFTNAKTPNITGLMAERPFASQWSFTAQRPLIQTGELHSVLGGKNSTRNAIVQFGKRHGVDAFEFNGIKDNKLNNTNVLAITENINPNRIGGYVRNGDWFVSENSPKKLYQQPVSEFLSIIPKSNFMELGPEWEGLESPYLTVYHRGLDGQQPYEHPKFKGILGGAGYDSSLDKWFNIKPEFKMTPNEARHFNLQKLADKHFGGDIQTALDYLNKNR